ncbi:MAG: diaminopimelate epimerase [Candidatus Omnitrophota bacterium]|jgi:diaminopimelate epimerase
MKKLEFTKMVATGNDFVVISGSRPRLARLARSICDRRFGIGADGLLVLDRSRKADARMRIFNADGSEAEMCGNGARCAAYYLNKKELTLDTKAGVLTAFVNGNNVKLQLSCSGKIRAGIKLDICGRKVMVDFINTGVPHAVIFVQGLEDMDIDRLGRMVRYHKVFAPSGANADFVEVVNANTIKVRTYERGVEAETLACGTGSTASALVFAFKSSAAGPVKVITRSKEILTISFKNVSDRFKDIWLEGRAKIVYKGVYHV